MADVSALLGGKASEEEIEELRREKSDAILDRVCEIHGVTAGELAKVKEETLVEWVKDTLPPEGKRNFVITHFRQMLEGYIDDYG